MLIEARYLQEVHMLVRERLADVRAAVGFRVVNWAFTILAWGLRIGDAIWGQPKTPSEQPDKPAGQEGADETDA